MTRIMLVDDEVTITMQLEESLPPMGYDVVGSASSGAEAVEMARSLSPDMILMDIVMPGEPDGIDAARTIKAELDIPVIFVTAYADDEFVRRAKTTEPFGYVVKPFQESELRATMEIALYKKGVERRLCQAVEGLANSRQQLRAFVAHLQSEREEKAALIAHQLDDDLGQLLAVLGMDLSWLRNRLIRDHESLLEKLDSMKELTLAVAQVVGRMSTELRPAILGHFGLGAAIEWQAEEIQKRTGIKCEVTVQPEDLALDQALSMALFRILEEALANVASHAGARKVGVRLEKEAGGVVLEVSDDGRGIGEKEISAPGSFGLIGMRERAYQWGGDFKITGVPGKGTTVRASIPLGEREPTSPDQS